MDAKEFARRIFGLADSIEKVDTRTIYFKNVGVTATQSESVTELLVEYSATGPDARLEQHSKWHCSWRPARKRGGLPQLASVEVTDFEETVLRSPDSMFADRTSAVFAGVKSYTDHISKSLEYWRERIDWRYTLETTSPYGLAVGDANGDGLDDVFMCEGGGLPNRLLVQRSDGTVEDRSASSGIDYLEPAYSALFLDLDNDGDQDLVFTSGRYVLFFANDGTGIFERKGLHQSESIGRSLCAADFDGDGWLDIYVCGVLFALRRSLRTGTTSAVS